MSKFKFYTIKVSGFETCLTLTYFTMTKSSFVTVGAGHHHHRQPCCDIHENNVQQHHIQVADTTTTPGMLTSS